MAANGHVKLMKHITTKIKNEEKLKTLLDSQNSMGHSPLHWAVLNNKQNSVDLLLELGANPNNINNKGMTPFDVAVEYNLEDLIKKLSRVTKLREDEINSEIDPDIKIVKEKPGKEGQELLEQVNKLAEKIND